MKKPKIKPAGDRSYAQTLETVKKIQKKVEGDWITEFDERFVEHDVSIDYTGNVVYFEEGRQRDLVTKDDIKQFISKAMEQARREEREEVVEKLEKMKYEGQNVYLNEAITEILDQLKKGRT